MSNNREQTMSDNKEETLQPEEPTGPDYINNLNTICLGEIFQRLPIEDKLVINTVCKRWKEISSLAWQNVKVLDFLKGTEDPSDYDQLPKKYKTTRWLGEILKRCGVNLKVLVLDDSKLLPIVAEHCENLLSLTVWQADPQDWDWAASFPKMDQLQVGYPGEIDESFTEKILQILSPESVTDISLRVFSPDKPTMAVGFIPAIKVYQGSFTPAALKTFESFTKLEVIHLINFKVDSNVLNVINQKLHLTDLSLEFSTLKTELLSPIILANLEHLMLDDVMGVTDNFLIQLSEVGQNLKSLSISKCLVTEKGIANFWKLPKLEELDVSGVMRISDAHLGKLRNLRKLNCEMCFHVGDNGLIELVKNAPNLELLTATFTLVSEELLLKAREIVKKRTNGLALKVLVENDLKEEWAGKDDTPLLIVETNEPIHLYPSMGL